MNLSDAESSASDARQLLREIKDKKHILLDELRGRVRSSKYQISRRKKQMIRELSEIYPITESSGRFSICDIRLDAEGHDVALGYIAHLVMIMSEVLGISLRFPITFNGSRSSIYCNRRNQLYLLSNKNGLALLNLDILQVRISCGLHTEHSNNILANLYEIIYKD